MTPWVLGPVELDFRQPVLMAILNATPDSFSDGGELNSVEAGLARAREHVEAGAQILDVGGESTRPGAKPVDANTESERVIPIIEGLRDSALPVAISVDTSKASVARAALAAGAHMVNDVTALRDPEMASVVADAGAHLCVMHMRGEPRTMQSEPIMYDDLLGEVEHSLRASTDQAIAAGVSSDRLMVDPGIGFGKTLEHNLELTRSVARLTQLGYPVLYGPSRKRFLGTLTGRGVNDRDRATAAAVTAGVIYGAHVVRVHNPAACVDAIRIAHALRLPSVARADGAKMGAARPIEGQP